jgi:hypothetical protein
VLFLEELQVLLHLTDGCLHSCCQAPFNLAGLASRRATEDEASIERLLAVDRTASSATSTAARWRTLGKIRAVVLILILSG